MKLLLKIYVVALLCATTSSYAILDGKKIKVIKKQQEKEKKQRHKNLKEMYALCRDQQANADEKMTEVCNKCFEELFTHYALKLGYELNTQKIDESLEQRKHPSLDEITE